MPTLNLTNDEKNLTVEALMHMPGSGNAELADKLKEKDKLNPHRHFYLYAKHHYKRTDMLKDLQAIAENYSGVPGLSLREIFEGLLLGLVYKAITCKGNNQEHFFEDFIKRLHPRGISNQERFSGEAYDYDRVAVRQSLGVLSIVACKDIEGDLGLPDPSILPLSEHYDMEAKEKHG